MKNSEPGSGSLVNLKHIRICISNGFNWYMQYQTTGKRRLKKLKQTTIYIFKSILFKLSSYIKWSMNSIEKLTTKQLD